MVCGHYASTRIHKLRDVRTCAGLMLYGRQTLKRMQQGMHPNPASTERIAELVLFTREQRAAAREAASRGIDGSWATACGRGPGSGLPGRRGAA